MFLSENNERLRILNKRNSIGRYIFFLLIALPMLLAFSVTNAFADVIVDNGEPGTSYAGTWRVSGGSEPYGDDSLWARNGATYNWQFDSQPSGVYEVLMWWSEWASRATDIVVDVNYTGGTETISIDQHEDAGQWNSLGEYYFDSSGSVTITAADGSSVSTCADAVWFRLISENSPPVAYIDSITSNPAEPGQPIEFLGHGTDNEGLIVAYQWESSIDGVLPDSNSDLYTTSSLSEGTHTISFRVQDDEGLWSVAVTQVLIVGTIPTEIITDNRDSETSQTGTWSVSGGAEPYGADSVWSRDGTTFTWHFNPPQTGDYEVSMWWTEWSSRSESVPVTINYEGDSATVNVNQQQNGGQWNSLGLFHFDVSSGGSVSITSQLSPSSTCADAVKFNFVPSNDPPTAIIDFITPNTADVGEMVSFTGHGEDSDGTIVAYSWDSSIDGHLSDDASFSTDSLFEGIHSISFKVQDNEGEWSAPATETLTVGYLPNLPPSAFIDAITPNPAYIGETVTFTGHGEDSDGWIIGYRWESSIDGLLSNEASFTTAELSEGSHTITFMVFDDVEVASESVTQVLTVQDIPIEVEIDNGGSGTYYTGTWSVSGGSDPYGDNSFWSRDGATYTWIFVPTVSSFYEVFMWWTEWPSRSTSVPVDIEHSDGMSTVYINQQENGGQWNRLGQYFFESGSTYRVTITAQPGPSSTCADAVKFVKVGTEVPPVADFSSDKITGGAPCTIQFYDQSTGIVTEWLWDFGDGQTSTEQNPSHEYTEVGIYSVTLTASNSYGSDTMTREFYIQVFASSENIYVADAFGAPSNLASLVNNALASIGAVENNGVWFYTNSTKGITYLIHWVDTIEELEQALKEEDAHVIFNGHSNYGLGSTFKPYSLLRDNVRYVDDDLIFNCSSDMVDVKIPGLKYGQAYPNWEPVFKDGTSAIAPYDFGDPRGLPPYNYYLTYTIPGDPTRYRVEQANGSFMERYPGAAPAWYSPDGSPPDPVENPEYFTINPAPEFNHCEFVGNWSYSKQDNDNKEYTDYNYHYALPGSGTNTAVWTLVVSYPGDYTAFASWQPDPANASNAKYTIQHADGSTTVEVDQRESGRCAEVAVEIYDGETLLDTVIVNQRSNAGDWNILGTYLFSGTARLVITSQGTCTTCADAARFVLSPDEHFVDNGDAGTSATGTWRVSYGPNPYNDSSLYSSEEGATYTFEAAANGDYEVSLWWTQRSNSYKYLGEYYFDEGVYTVELSNNADGRVIADTVRLAFNDLTKNLVQAEFQADVASGTSPLTVRFDDLSYASEGIDGCEWYWDFGDGTFSYDREPIHAYTTPGVYTVSLKVTDELENEDTEVKEAFIVVETDPPLHAEFTSTDRRTPKVSFVDQSSGDITSWEWDFGDGTTSTEQNPTHSYKTGGQYTVTLTVYGPGGSETEIEDDFACCPISVDNQDEYKPHFGSKVILDASSAIDFSVEELKYSRLFQYSCHSGKYYFDRYHRGLTFYTTTTGTGTDPVAGYLTRYLLGETDEEILVYLNSLKEIYAYYNFDLLPPSMR